MLNSSLLLKRFASKACYEIRIATTSLRKKAAPRFGFISLRKTIRDYVATKLAFVIRFSFFVLRPSLKIPALEPPLIKGLKTFFVLRSSSFVLKLTLYKVIVYFSSPRPLVLTSPRSVQITSRILPSYSSQIGRETISSVKMSVVGVIMAATNRMTTKACLR